MKPSQKIEQLKDYSKCPTSKLGDLEGKVITGEMECAISIQAIIDFLDEEWEKNKTPEQQQYDVIKNQK